MKKPKTADGKRKGAGRPKGGGFAFGRDFSTNDDMKTELQYSTNVYSERSTPPDAKPVLYAVCFNFLCGGN